MPRNLDLWRWRAQRQMITRMRDALRVFLCACVVCVACGGVTIESVRAELIARAKADQDARQKAMSVDGGEQMLRVAHEIETVDTANTAALKRIMATFGWPDRARFGAEASSAAWLLAQHADADPEFQAAVLPQLEQAANNGEASKKELAYLVDRVRVHQKRPQVYGTQYAELSGEHGGTPSVDLPVVEDIAHLDDRRRAAGLEPWSEYEARMAKMQGRAPVERPRAATER